VLPGKSVAAIVAGADKTLSLSVANAAT